VNGTTTKEQSAADDKNNKRIERIVNDVLLLSKKDQLYVLDVLNEKLGLK